MCEFKFMKRTILLALAVVYLVLAFLTMLGNYVIEHTLFNLAQLFDNRIHHEHWVLFWLVNAVNMLATYVAVRKR